ncbi:hypothetical protein ALC57_17943 [Trachymyrmex cornetzi]|uniref:Uncharacterized protein n=1 Tax=Trachymyrmex cornetzi TaxID=471704 RepID=A0A195DAQ2_9HYME|nr:hypothetical protein ALC57_17943 [Trachymyrmex cornetzi]
MDKVMAEVKEGRSERTTRRYGGEGPEPGIYNETKKGYSVFLRRHFPPPISSLLSPRWFYDAGFFSLAMHAA